MEEDHHHHHLLQPLLPVTTTTTDFTSTTTAFVDVDDNIKLASSSNSKIILRLFFIVFVGILSLWANHEASKGFEIHLENNAAANSAAGRRFKLSYVSNDKATRLVLNTSKFVETLLYPNNVKQPKKQVNRVTLRLGGSGDRNLTHTVVVFESFKEHEFVVTLSPSTMEETNVDHAMLRAVQQGMTRVWLYDDENAPKSLVNGMVEYISSLAGLGGGVAESDCSAADGGGGGGDSPESDNICWKDENPRAVACFLNYCEKHGKGFIQRLNQAMRLGWHDRTVEDALGMPAQHLCSTYISQKHLAQ